MSRQRGMLPPWKILHEFQTSIGWSMGGGEDYIERWHNWFTGLDETAQQVYMAQHPEPEDWFCFYRLHGLPPINWGAVIESYGDDPAKIPEGFLSTLRQPAYELVEKAERLWNSYCNLHNELACVHEEAEHIQQAVEHLGKVVFVIERYAAIWEKTKISEAKTRYTVLKQRLTHQMALNPVIRKGWDALRHPEHRRPLTLKRTTVSIEDYARMQQEVFYPSELGRTWIHCFEADALYIHRHWREPCLFLVVLEPAEPGYRIAEAWLNDDPSIARPLTRPPMEPEALLTQLLSRFIT